jgi:hypothetical protein
MDKKGIELSLNTIIIAIILLIVLVVIIAIFTGTIGNIAEHFNSHADRAGEESENALNELSIFSCENGEVKCRGNDVYKCIEHLPPLAILPQTIRTCHLCIRSHILPQAPNAYNFLMSFWVREIHQGTIKSLEG